MTTDHAHTLAGMKLAAAAAAAAAVIVGSMVLAGWAFDIAVLKSILPGWVSMKANTAFCFILTGVALLLTAIPPVTLNPKRAVFLSRLARLCGLLVGLIGLLTLGEYIFGWNLDIDQWLFRESADTVGTLHPGRMALETALNFVSLSVALWLTGGSPHIHRIIRTRLTILASVSLGLLVVAHALAALLSHATPGLGVYGWFGSAMMAESTAILFALLGMAVIAISWQPEVLSWSLGRNTTVAFVCGMVLLVFIGLSTNRSQFWMEEMSGRIAYTEKAQGDVDNLQAEAIDAHVHTRDYLITGEERFLKLYLSAIADSNTKLDELRRVEFVTAEAAHQQHFTLIDAQVKAQFQWLQQMMDASRTGMTDAARNSMIGHADSLLDGLRTTFGQVKSDHHRRIRQLKQEAENVSRSVSLITFTGTLASLLIFLIVVFRLNSAENERKHKEDEYRTVIYTSLDGFCIADLSGRILDVNEAYCQMLGYTREEFLRLQIRDFEASESPEETAAHFQKFIRTGSDRFQTRQRRKDGAILDVEASAQYVAALGERIFSFIRDITESKRAIKALEENEQHFRAVTESANDAIITAAGAGNIIGWNAAAGRLFGYSEAEMIGQSLTVLMPERFRNLHSAGLARVVAGGTPHVIGKTVELAGLRKDGSEFPLEFSLAQWQAADGKFFTAIIRDITERKQAGLQLNEQIEELRRWHEATLGREMRTLELKHEVNELLGQAGQPPRYPSAEQVE